MSRFLSRVGVSLLFLSFSVSSNALLAFRIDFDSQVDFVAPGFSNDLGRSFTHIMFLSSVFISETTVTADSATYVNPVSSILRFASEGESSDLDGVTVNEFAVSEVTVINSAQDALALSVEDLFSFSGNFWRLQLNLVFDSDSIFDSTELTEFLNVEKIAQGLEGATVNTLSLFNMDTGELVSQGRIGGYTAVDRLASVPIPSGGLLFICAIAVLGRLKTRQCSCA